MLKLPDEPGHIAPMPRRVRLALAGILGLLIAGALYLVAVRGEAILLDLGKLSGTLFCF